MILKVLLAIGCLPAGYVMLCYYVKTGNVNMDVVAKL
jgi:hypothetical protein